MKIALLARKMLQQTLWPLETLTVSLQNDAEETRANVNTNLFFLPFWNLSSNIRRNDRSKIGVETTGFFKTVSTQAKSAQLKMSRVQVAYLGPVASFSHQVGID